MRTREKKNKSLHKHFLSNFKLKTRNRRKKRSVRRKRGGSIEYKNILKTFYKYAFVCACIIICKERTHLLEGFNMAYEGSTPIIQWFISVINMFCSSVSSVHMTTNQAITSLVTLISPVTSAVSGAAGEAAAAVGEAAAAADVVLNKFLYDAECWGLNSGLALILTGILSGNMGGAMGPIQQMEQWIERGYVDADQKIKFGAGAAVAGAGGAADKFIELCRKVNEIGNGINAEMRGQFSSRMDVVNAVEERINRHLDNLSEKLADISMKTIFIGKDLAAWFIPSEAAIQEKIDIGEEAAEAFAEGLQKIIPMAMRVMRITNDCAVNMGARFGAMNQKFIRSKPYLVDLLDSCFTFVQGYFELPEMADVAIENGLPRGGALWQQLKTHAKKLTTLTSRPLHPALEERANEVFIPLSPDDVESELRSLNGGSTLIESLASEYHSVADIEFFEEHGPLDPTATPSPLGSGSFGRGSPESPYSPPTKIVRRDLDLEVSPAKGYSPEGSSSPPSSSDGSSSSSKGGGKRKTKKGGAGEVDSIGDKQYMLNPLKWTDRNIKYMIESSLENGMIVDDQGITFYTLDLQAEMMKKDEAYRRTDFTEPLLPTNDEERARYVGKFVESLTDKYTPPSTRVSINHDDYCVLCNALSFKPRFYAPGADVPRGDSPSSASRSSMSSITSVNSVGSLRNQLQLASTAMMGDDRDHLVEVLRASTKRKFIDI